MLQLIGCPVQGPLGLRVQVEFPVVAGIKIQASDLTHFVCVKSADMVHGSPSDTVKPVPAPVGSQLIRCGSDPGKQVGMAGEIVRCEDDKLGIRDFDSGRAGSQGIRCIRSRTGAAQQRQQQDRHP